FTLMREPTVNACARHDGSRLLACGSEPDHGWSLGFSTDAGEHWTPLFTLSQLRQVASCPASSPTAQVCTPLLPGLINALSPPGSTPPPPASPAAREGGCAAVAGGGALPVLGALLALALLRRRRKVGTQARAG
ncbi:MAG TPA: MYXO-CTERM sorting domain-containing protein, partial [Aggregicoccus sp.]|nr:MYXO-CTERM sorting domain-containing protein [Aggregicoccus sp.]